MFVQNFNKVGKMEYYTQESLNLEEAKIYAMNKIHQTCQKGATIGKVFVNGKLVLENVKIS